MKKKLKKATIGGEDIISMGKLNRYLIEKILRQADRLKKMPVTKQLKILKGKIAILLFFEPSSRTFSSHAAAFKRLGGQTIDFQNPNQTSSAVKGESIEDSIRVFSQYGDIIVIRHPQKGTAQIAADCSAIPVINAGDGIGEHPTQTLLDLYTIKNRHGLDNVSGLLAGDLLNGRTVHSLIKGLGFFKKPVLYLLSPDKLRLGEAEKTEAEKQGVSLIEIKSAKEIPTGLDFWYWTRVQKERFDNISEYEKLKHSFVLTAKLANEKASKKTIFLHPLPRVGEIDPAVDNNPRSLYLSEQIRNGLFVRMALFSLILK